MKILVVGASGQVAQSLYELGTKSAHQVHTLGRPDLDITDEASISAALSLFKPKLVVNAAAYTAVDRAEEENSTAYAINSAGAGSLAKLAAGAELPIVHISTDYVFDGTKDGAYRETDPASPLGAYGRSKWAGEEAVRAENPQHIIFRTAWVFSPFGSNFVKTMLRLSEDREDINVVNNQFGNPTYAPHLATGILSICDKIEQKPAHGSHNWGTYHVAGTGHTNWAELARAVFEESRALGGPSAKVNGIPSDQYPTKAQRPSNSRLDLELAERDWGIVLPTWKHGVRDCVRRLIGQYEQRRS